MNILYIILTYKHVGQGVLRIRTEKPWTWDTWFFKNENQHNHKLLLVASLWVQYPCEAEWKSDIVLCFRDMTSGSGINNFSLDSCADGSCSILFFNLPPQKAWSSSWDKLWYTFFPLCLSQSCLWKHSPSKSLKVPPTVSFCLSLRRWVVRLGPLMLAARVLWRG